ncbi:energy transducer TonB [Erythrobacter sp. JK5]|uniref:energy transducer TonB n=1 Tax=Erythrobacter sp. JK5 TaxID=2829500 RepID=UPI001BACC49D|nr:energy transducer TonB [Erythrobacter sp. JK5]QUL37932.1 energy transducer TonB [Erythrobacter sp. JK5]
MGETATFRPEDKAGLLVALVLHVAVVALLLFQPARDEIVLIPERMTVSLASDVSLESTAPDPVPESRAAIAPTLGEEVAPDPVSELREATPEAPPPLPPRTAATAPRTQPTTSPRQPARTPPRATPTQRAANSGGSRIGEDFLPGQGGSTTTTETRIPASQIGSSAKASIQQALARQVKPHWSAPQGVDVDQLVTLLDFDLNEDGSLKGRPRLRAQSGVSDSNRPQASRHVENAIRAVQLAAPFDLPDEYYNAWKSIRGARFDRNLSR